MSHILEAAPDIGWEMDVAWVIRGGADPAAVDRGLRQRASSPCMSRTSPRPARTLDEDGWADVGHGTVDWKGLYKLLQDKHTKAKHFVMEHDKPSDVERFAKRSIAAANNF